MLYSTDKTTHPSQVVGTLFSHQRSAASREIAVDFPKPPPKIVFFGSDNALTARCVRTIANSGCCHPMRNLEGADFGFLTMASPHSVRYQLWHIPDTRFASLTQAYYRGAEMACIMATSQIEVERYRDRLQQYMAYPVILCFIKTQNNIDNADAWIKIQGYLAEKDIPYSCYIPGTVDYKPEILRLFIHEQYLKHHQAFPHIHQQAIDSQDTSSTSKSTQTESTDWQRFGCTML